MRIMDGQTAAAFQAAGIVQQLAPEAPPPQEAGAEMDTGPDRKASGILTSFAQGKRPTRREIGYIARTRPDQVGLVQKSCAERCSLERQMRKARSKQEVRWAHVNAVANAGKSAATAGEGYARVNQLTDARNEYMKTPEYWRKPDQTPVRKKQAAANDARIRREGIKPSLKSCEASCRFRKATEKQAGGIRKT